MEPSTDFPKRERSRSPRRHRSRSQGRNNRRRSYSPQRSRSGSRDDYRRGNREQSPSINNALDTGVNSSYQPHAGRSYEERTPRDMNTLRESSQQDRRVYVGNLSYDVKWHHLKDFMRQGEGMVLARHDRPKRAVHRASN